jgi:hypothetical protein
MWHDGWIEEGRRLKRVLMAEIGAEHQLLFLGESSVKIQTWTSQLELPPEKCLDHRVAFPKFRLHPLPHCTNFVCGKCHDLTADRSGAGFVRE